MKRINLSTHNHKLLSQLYHFTIILSIGFLIFNIYVLIEDAVKYNPFKYGVPLILLALFGLILKNKIKQCNVDHYQGKYIKSEPAKPVSY